jgi:hypothetical protein
LVSNLIVSVRAVVNVLIDGHGAKNVHVVYGKCDG